MTTTGPMYLSSPVTSREQRVSLRNSLVPTSQVTGEARVSKKREQVTFVDASRRHVPPHQQQRSWPSQDGHIASEANTLRSRSLAPRRLLPGGINRLRAGPLCSRRRPVRAASSDREDTAATPAIKRFRVAELLRPGRHTQQIAAARRRQPRDDVRCRRA